MFRGCKTEDMPPHVYSLAQTAYRSLVETRRDQSLIFMGRSGSGKTTSFKHALNYLALAAGMSLCTHHVVVVPLLLRRRRRRRRIATTVHCGLTSFCLCHTKNCNSTFD